MAPPIDAATHAAVVRYIAANRFPFPGQQTWPADYVTFTNESGQNQAVATADGAMYPDIVVLDGSGRVREAGMVETDVSVERARRWAAVAPACDDHTKTGVRHFFVYVPAGLEHAALDLLRRHDVSFAGLRTYAVEGERITITPVVTPGDPQDHR